ncbi:hypothetical protein BayCH28_12695 [Mycolicibacterium sp. CH28]|uniref:hypothetical protein n=1 Tax=Mycolicibacterium sp. CH28 TaxID=2512237 RepID=UPI001080FA6B|nr:hypothetical protein [Mycolicibacterium sp. CH28]TGD88563.1 hypothetical protein BayCH28_12695 [Mycolicibacterium sp. CH28]
MTAVIQSPGRSNIRVQHRYGDVGLVIHQGGRTIILDAAEALQLADHLVDLVEQQRAGLGTDATKTVAGHNHTNQRPTAALSQAESAGID